LALARALYKDAPVIVLDEPTAALDPIAESEIYQKYADLTKGKTSVYISHRLASTRFCDRILLLDGQTVAEQGTHEELMRLGGKYAYMFGIQSSYYSADKEVHS
jgi:ABC-type multidrug transport system fused ATPase/permease subunit